MRRAVTQATTASASKGVWPTKPFPHRHERRTVLLHCARARRRQTGGVPVGHWLPHLGHWPFVGANTCPKSDSVRASGCTRESLEKPCPISDTHFSTANPVASRPSFHSRPRWPNDHWKCDESLGRLRGGSPIR